MGKKSLGFTKNFTFIIDFFIAIVYDNIAKYGYQNCTRRVYAVLLKLNERGKSNGKA